MIRIIPLLLLLISTNVYANISEVFSKFVKDSNLYGQKYYATYEVKKLIKDPLNCRHFGERVNPKDPMELFKIYEKYNALGFDTSLETYKLLHQELIASELSKYDPVIANIQATWKLNFPISFNKSLENNEFKFFDLFRFSNISINGIYDIFRANIEDYKNKIILTMQLSYGDICGKSTQSIIINPTCKLENLRNIQSCDPRDSINLILNTSKIKDSINAIKKSKTLKSRLDKRRGNL